MIGNSRLSRPDDSSGWFISNAAYWMTAWIATASQATSLASGAQGMYPGLWFRMLGQAIRVPRAGW